MIKFNSKAETLSSLYGALNKGLVLPQFSFTSEDWVNVSGDIVYSRYELGIELSRLMNKNINLIKSVLSQDFNTLAERPKNTSFDNSMMKRFGIIPTSLKESLYLMNII